MPDMVVVEKCNRHVSQLIARIANVGREAASCSSGLGIRVRPPCLWRQNFFSFAELLFRGGSFVPQKVRNIDSLVGFHFAVSITFDAQNQLHRHVRTQNDGFQYSRES